jgi:hypothetical protein
MRTDRLTTARAIELEHLREDIRDRRAQRRVWVIMRVMSALAALAPFVWIIVHLAI